MGIINDFGKIKRQLLGEENIFGYKTTLANQLYTIYCVLGIERYFTNEFHTRTKVFFLTWHFFGLIVPFLILFVYVLFLEKNDFVLLLHVLFVIVSFVYMRIFMPILFYWYANDFKRMMDEIDSTIWHLTSNSSKLRNMIDIKSTARNYMIFFCTFQAIFALITTLDVMFFYEEEKLKNYSYYVFPLPKLDKYGNSWVFSTCTIFGIIATAAFTLELCALFGIPMMLAVICHNEVLLICYMLRQQSIKFYTQFENMLDGDATSMQIEMEIESLRHTLIIGVNRYQRVIEIIKCFKGFYTTLSLFTLSSLFIFSVSHVYAILTMQGSYVLKLKEISISISTFQVMYYFCKIGDIFHELVTIMSHEVYSIPWYCVTQIRKDVFVFLCQAQHEMNLKAAKVYPLMLTLFLRFLNSVYSTVNVLCRVTS